MVEVEDKTVEVAGKKPAQDSNDGIRLVVIDIRKVIGKLLERKWRIIISTFLVAVLSSVLIVCVPRGYTSQVMLAPEDESGAASSLSEIASSFGFDFAAMRSSDAIYPLLYPDLFKSNDFVVGLFEIEVEKLDGSLRTTYLDYLMNYQKHAPWQPVIYGLKKLISPKPLDIPEGAKRKDGVDPFMLTAKEDRIAKKVKEYIECTVDKKTNVITITVEDQDPLICATMADSACARLQNFITRYRTSKARADYEYYTALAEGAKLDYERSMKAYSDYCDSHKGNVRQAYASRRDELENEMNTNYSALTAMNTQIQAAKARIQERTPAFTMLQNASVPTKPSSPKRMIFVLFMTILGGVISCFVALKKILAEEE